MTLKREAGDVWHDVKGVSRWVIPVALVLAGIGFAAGPVKAGEPELTVRTFQWSLNRLVPAKNVHRESYYRDPGVGCVFAIRTAHLGSKDIPTARASYFVIDGVTAIVMHAAPQFDPPLIQAWALQSMALINNQPYDQWMVGTVTGYHICGLYSGEEADAWILIQPLLRGGN